MKRIKSKNLILIFSGFLILGVFIFYYSYRVLSNQLKISEVANISQINNAHDKLNGTFLDFGTPTSLPENEIDPFFAELSEIGMDTVIIGYIQKKETGCDTSDFIWSPGMPGKLNTIFSSAQKYNLSVYVGLVANIGCNSPYTNPNKNIVTQYLTNLSSPSNPIKYINDNFGNHQKFAGWYIPDEPNIFMWMNDPGDAHDYYKKYSDAIKSVSNKPILISPSLNEADRYSNPNSLLQVAGAIKELKRKSGIDIMVLQDAVNQSGISLTPGDRHTTGQFYEAVSAEIGSNALWADLELGNCCLIASGYNSGAYKPTSLARLIEQINMAPSSIVSKRVTWFNQAQLTRTTSERMPGSERLFASYKSLLTTTDEYSYLTPVSYNWITSPSTQYPDSNNQEMFDLNAGEGKNYLDPSYTGISGTAELVIDLGSAKKIQWIGVHTLNYSAGGIIFPANLQYSCSVDNINWSTQKTFEPLLTKNLNIDRTDSEFVFGNPNGAPINQDCQFIKLKLNNPDKWTFVSEIELISGTHAVIPGDLNFDGAVDIKDYSLIISGYGTLYTIFDYGNIITNYGCTNNCIMMQ